MLVLFDLYSKMVDFVIKNSKKLFYLQFFGRLKDVAIFCGVLVVR